MAASPFKFTVFLFIAFVLFSPSENIAEAKLCRRLSSTFSGFCGRNCSCDVKCLREGAVSGSCHVHGLGRACFCYRKC